MPIYDIAGLRVEMLNIDGRTEKQAIPYLSKDQDEKGINIRINVSPERIERSMKAHPELNHDDWEYMLTGSDFYNAVLSFNGFLLHSSCIVVDGIAYAFSADSGVGKSTHTSLWLKHFGDRAYILNDDKPCIRSIDGEIYACGTPWSGKYDISKPKNVKLGGICFLQRSEDNWIRPASTKNAVFNIFSQTVRKLKPSSMDKLLNLLDELLNQIDIYEMGCNTSSEAVLTSYNAMKKDI